MKLNRLLINDYYVVGSFIIKNKTVCPHTFIFFALGLIGILNHELLLDESQH